MSNYKSILKLASYATFGVFIGFIISSLFLWEKENINREEAELFQSSYNYAVKKASPAVVNIYSEQIINRNSQQNRRKFNPLFNRSGQIKTSLGSGVILSSDGYILTNQHVIGDNTLRVTTELYDGRKFNAQLVGIDKGTDLAVLKIEDSDSPFPSIEIADSDKVN